MNSLNQNVLSIYEMPSSPQVLGTQRKARDTRCRHSGGFQTSKKTDIKGFMSVVLNQGKLSFGGHLATSRDIFGCHSRAGGAKGHEKGGPRDVVTHSTMHGTASPPHRVIRFETPVPRRRNVALFHKHFDHSEVQGLGEMFVLERCVTAAGVRKGGRGSHTATQGEKADFPALLGLLASSSSRPQPPEHGRNCGRQDNAPKVSPSYPLELVDMLGHMTKGNESCRWK